MRIDLGLNIEKAIGDGMKKLKIGFKNNMPTAEIDELKKKINRAKIIFFITPYRYNNRVKTNKNATAECIAYKEPSSAKYNHIIYSKRDKKYPNKYNYDRENPTCKTCNIPYDSTSILSFSHYQSPNFYSEYSTSKSNKKGHRG